MNWLDFFAKWLASINRWLCYGGMVLLLPMMFMTTIDVVARSLFNHPLTGTYELSGYLLACFVLLGIAYTYQERGHIRVNLAVALMPKKLATACSIVSVLLSMFVIGALAWEGWKLGMEQTIVSEQLRIPQRPFQLLVPVCATSLMLAMFIELLQILTDLPRKS